MVRDAAEAIEKHRGHARRFESLGHAFDLAGRKLSHHVGGNHQTVTYHLQNGGFLVAEEILREGAMQGQAKIVVGRGEADDAGPADAMLGLPPVVVIPGKLVLRGILLIARRTVAHHQRHSPHPPFPLVPALREIGFESRLHLLGCNDHFR